MYQPEPGMRLRPMRLGDILDETFTLYRRHFVTLVVTAAVWAVPVAILTVGMQFVIGSAAAPGREPTLQTALTLFALAVPLAIVGGIGYLLGGAAIVKLASDAILGHELRIGAAYSHALSRLAAVLVAGLLGGLALFGLSITVIGIPFAIYLGVGWALSWQAIVIEQRGGGRALSRSSQLVGGHRWRTFGLSLLLSILSYILISLPASLVGGLFGAFTDFDRPGSGAFILFNAFTGLFSALGQALFAPLTWIALTVLYYDLRVRKEAFDLERATQRIDDDRTLELRA